MPPIRSRNGRALAAWRPSPRYISCRYSKPSSTSFHSPSADFIRITAVSSSTTQLPRSQANCTLRNSPNSAPTEAPILRLWKARTARSFENTSATATWPRTRRFLPAFLHRPFESVPELPSAVRIRHGHLRPARKEAPPLSRQGLLHAMRKAPELAPLGDLPQAGYQRGLSRNAGGCLIGFSKREAHAKRPQPTPLRCRADETGSGAIEKLGKGKGAQPQPLPSALPIPG